MFCQCGIHYTTQVAQKQQVDLSGYALININSDKKQRHFSVFATSKVKKKKKRSLYTMKLSRKQGGQTNKRALITRKTNYQGKIAPEN